jgi:cell division protein FtsN
VRYDGHSLQLLPQSELQLQQAMNETVLSDYSIPAPPPPAAPAVAAAPTPAAPAPPAAAQRWTVVAGEFPTLAKAGKQVHRLALQKLDARTRPGSHGYRVTLGEFSHRADAERSFHQIQKQHHLKHLRVEALP